MLDKSDLRLALRLSLAELNISMHSSKLNGLVRHILKHLDQFKNTDNQFLPEQSPLL